MDGTERAGHAAARARNTARRVGFDEWVRFGFTDADAAWQFRAEAHRIVPGLVEEPLED
jgi:hypothetical protein